MKSKGVLRSLARFGRRFVLCGAVLGVAVWSGCGQKATVSEDSGPVPTTVHPNGKPVDADSAATVSGTIKLDGAPPKARTINMAAVPKCAKEHEGDPAKLEDVVPGDDGTLQNVVVYLEGDFSAYAFPIPERAATLDQQGCVYQPHVLALMVDQPLTVSTSDMTSHNVHPIPKKNPSWNRTEEPGAAPFQQRFSRAEIGIPIKCNIHPWMKAYVAVFDMPYFAVTGKDGAFELRNIPPGSYTLTAWQETYGTVQQKIVLGAKEAKSVTLTFKAS